VEESSGHNVGGVPVVTAHPAGCVQLPKTSTAISRAHLYPTTCHVTPQGPRQHAEPRLKMSSKAKEESTQHTSQRFKRGGWRGEHLILVPFK
jgi:hypothetical protein